MTSPTFRAVAGTVLSLAALAAFAQTSTTPNGQTPGSVGVTPQTAVEATHKAVPRSDTGTVVRTSPSAADKARSAADRTTAATASTTSNAGMASGSTGAAPVAAGTTTMAAVAPMATRRARADRN